MKINKFFKRGFLTCLILFLTLSLIACSGQNNEESNSNKETNIVNKEEINDDKEIDTKEIAAKEVVKADEEVSDNQEVDNKSFDNSNTKIEILTREYISGNIAEVLSISYKGETNPEIESINRVINQGVQREYLEFMDGNYEDSWIDIRSYPFQNEDYLQIVTTSIIYPTYGTDGDLYSYNYDLVENKFISTDDILMRLGTDRKSIAEEVGPLVVEAESDVYKVLDVNVAGFLILEGQYGNLTQLLLQVEISPEMGEPWKVFYSYIPENGELLQLNRECLFDPADMIQMEQPLCYQFDVSELFEIPEIGINIEGLEELEAGVQYLYDGMVEYTIEKLTRVDYDKDSILKQIKNSEGMDIELITLTQSDEHSKLTTYPCWLIVYKSGQNEDTRFCEDVYMQTDEYDYRVHSSVPADFSQEYHDEIGERLATIHWRK